eukprot:7828676-Alexandrium_andersonii.AAC.1
MQDSIPQTCKLHHHATESNSMQRPACLSPPDQWLNAPQVASNCTCRRNVDNRRRVSSAAWDYG